MAEDRTLQELAEGLAALSPERRKEALRALDGPPRRERNEAPATYIPLPTLPEEARWRVVTRVVRADDVGRK